MPCTHLAQHLAWHLPRIYPNRSAIVSNSCKQLTNSYYLLLLTRHCIISISPTYEKGVIFIPILQRRKLKLREENKLARVTERVSGGARIPASAHLNQTQSPSPVLPPEYNQNQSDTRKLCHLQRTKSARTREMVTSFRKKGSCLSS